MAYQLHEILLYWNLLPSAHFGLVETSTDGHLSMTYIYHLQMNVQLLVEKLELLLGLRVHEVRSKGVFTWLLCCHVKNNQNISRNN